MAASSSLRLHGATSYPPSHPLLPPNQPSPGSSSRSSIAKAALAAFTLFGCLLLVGHLAFRPLQSPSRLSSPQLLASACAGTRFPEVCISSLSPAGDLADRAEGLLSIEISKLAIHQALRGLRSVHSTVQNLRKRPAEQKGKEGAIFRDCVELLDRAHTEAQLALDNVQHLEKHFTQSKVGDIRTFLSAALTFHTTCTDEFSGIHNVDLVKAEGSYVEKLISNALAFATQLHTSSSAFSGILEATQPEKWTFSFQNWFKPENRLPEWMDARDVQLLQAISPTPNVTVALDGSGMYKSIQAAVNAAPQKSASRYVIYIKTGTYNEQVNVPKAATNLMFIGDGIGKTIITGSKNVQQPNVTTFTSGTVVVDAKGFLARDLTFQNTAGAVNHQAVALRVSGDQAALYKCSMEGYQDTLYTHALRQFYRECTVYGTIDYIFGNAAAVFQSCKLLARVPLKSQKNTYTAQGRTDPNQNTGLSFQSCTVDGTADLIASINSYPTYLGRPWKEYCVTVFLQSYQSSVVNAAGWLPWSGDFALATLFYGEYQCSGPGAGAAGRVTWSTQITNSSVASKYTVASLLDGTTWLPTTNVPYQAGL